MTPAIEPLRRYRKRSTRSRYEPGLLAFIIAAALAVPNPATTQETDESDGNRWTPALSMQYRAIQGTALSPDGDRVAYVVRVPLMEGDQSEYRSHVWVAATDGSWARQFTHGEQSAGSPSFSPDGQWLAFTTGRGSDEENGGRNQVWILPLSGGEARPATDAQSGVGLYRWSPDGTRIAYVMRDPETKAEKKAKSEKTDVILVDQNFKYGHLYLVNVDPGAEEVPDAARLTAGEYHVTGFDWSPNGTNIVFGHQPDPRINTGRLSGDISIVSIPSSAEIEAAREAEAAEAEAIGAEATEATGEEGEDEGDEDSDTSMKALGQVTRLVTGAGVESSPRWSPDGSRIAFVSTGSQIEPIGLGDLYVVSSEGGEPRKLVETPNRSGGILAWSGDSRHIYINEALGTTRHVLAVPLQGGEIRKVSSGDGVVGSVSMTPDGDQMAFTWQTTDQPWDVYVSATTSYEPHRVTDTHAGVPRPAMGRTELLAWTAPDGTPVEGLLTYPVDYEAGHRYPLILNVHGGPAGVYSQSFTGSPGIYMLQYFAQEGFAILRPNPRGSTGYGKEFRYANFRDWGYGDLSDLLAGVDHVVEMGVAHSDSLLLMGWSYGGYMTSFAVTQTDRFKAASMGAGLPNLVSMTTTTDIQDYLVGHMGAEFWEDYEAYEKHSAIYHIANVKTPTQVIHGENDLRVPFTQGQEFYRALLRRGVETEFVVYPRTPHGPREPKFVMDVSERILKWFNEHLRSEPVTAAVR
jgi:dipeptidyl aminopeptidase/acylaminoacyl peptidase